MDKPYFAKYLPVSGEIKEGDNYLHEDGSVMKWGHLTGNPEKWKGFQKVKLFLCSRDIKEGDKFYSLSRNVYDIVSNEHHLNLLKIQIKAIVKVIGEISPEAIWAKEGDEFEEDEVYITPICYDSDDNWQYACLYCGRKSGECPNDEGNKVLIKCSQCKHFH